MDASAPTAASLCPLCGAPNGCALEAQRRTGVEQRPCWCREATFTPGLLARVPPAARNHACICPDCASRGGGDS